MPSPPIPRYLSEPALPGDRGYAFGVAQANRVANTLARYRELFAAAQQLGPPQIRELGGQVAERLWRDWPDAAAEISGIAAGARADEGELFAANARTEILAGATAPECSAVGVLPARSATGTLLLAQNWDWHPTLAPSRVLWTITWPGERWLTTLTEAGILGKVGLNSSGLGVLLNILHCSLDGGTGGLPVHVLLRLLLERCQDMAAALALIRAARTSASSCVTVGWQQGQRAELVSAELSPGGPNLIWPDRGLVLHTNHFRPAPPAGQDRYAADWPDTVARLGDLDGGFSDAEVISPRLIRRVLRSHRGGPLSVCCHGEHAAVLQDQAATLASIVLDLGAAAMSIAAGPPCTHAYQDVPAGVTAATRLAAAE